jgi:hypothetical protein
VSFHEREESELRRFSIIALLFSFFFFFFEFFEVFVNVFILKKKIKK